MSQRQETSLPSVMKAVKVSNFGEAKDVLQFVTDFPVPQKLKPTQVLVRVRAASVNPIDWEVRRGQFRKVFPQTFPCVLGKDGAGEVVRVGEKVQRLAIGDEVFGFSKAGTDTSRLSQGTYAQYAVFDESELAKKPSSLSWKQAAMLPVTLLTPYQMIKMHNGPIKSIVINGASGGTGSFAVLLAKHFFRIEKVYAVCSAKNADYVKKLGADRVIDYNTENFVDVIKAEQPDGLVDHFVSCAGGSDLFAKVNKILSCQGHFVTISMESDGLLSFFGRLYLRKAVSVFGCAKFDYIDAQSNPDYLEELGVWLTTEEGQRLLELVPVTEFDLEDIVKATELSESRRVTGKIVLNIP